MYVDRPGLGKRFHAAKAIIGEENSARLSRLNGLQAVATWSGICSSFRMCWKSVTRRAQGRADSFGDLRWYGYDSNGLHDLIFASPRFGAALGRYPWEEYCPKFWLSFYPVCVIKSARIAARSRNSAEPRVWQRLDHKRKCLPWRSRMPLFLRLQKLPVSLADTQIR